MGKQMRKGMWMSAASLVAAALVLIIFVRRGAPDAPDASIPDTTKTPAQNHAEVPARGAPSGTVGKSPQQAARLMPRAGTAFSSLPTSRMGLDLNTDPFGAESKEEQEWLDRNGYPNEKQWLAYKGASESLLAQAAEQGDSFAGIELNKRRLARGDKQGHDELLRSAMLGSQFALESLAAYMAGSSQGDAQGAYMLYRLGELRGNSDLAMARETLTERLPPPKRMEAEGQARMLFRKFGTAFRAQNGPGARFTDPRPFGAD